MKVTTPLSKQCAVLSIVKRIEFIKFVEIDQYKIHTLNLIHVKQCIL